MNDIHFGSSVGDALRSILLFLPKAIAFVAILVIGWFVAKAVRKIVDKVLERVGFDRAVDRGGIKTALARSRYDASDIIAKLAFYAVLLFTLQLAFGIWGPNPISTLIAGIIAWLPRAFVAIVIIVVAAAIANAVKDLIGSALGGLSYGKALATIASVFILGLGVIAALNQIGVATSVTTPVLIAILATVGGILVVGVGGGLVRPMQSRWESWLNHAERESRAITEHARAYQATQARAETEMTQSISHPERAVASDGPTAGGGRGSLLGVDDDPIIPTSGRDGDPTPGVESTPAVRHDPSPAANDDPTVATSQRRDEPSTPRDDTTMVIPRQSDDPTTPIPAQDAEATQVIPPRGTDGYPR